jgi:DNA-binding Lrp family transcriptional regulator
MGRDSHDETDLEMLEILQWDGRCSVSSLAARVGLTAPPCLRRLRTLEEDGTIKGYHAVIDPTLLGFHVTAFVFVSLKSQTTKNIREFERFARDWPIIRECHFLHGRTDFLLKCVSEDLSTLQYFLEHFVASRGNVEQVKMSVAARPTKRDGGVPI